VPLCASLRVISPQRRLSHARGYLSLGLVAEAAEELDAIVGPEAETPDVMSLRLAVCHEQKDWPRVRELARTLVQLEPGEAALWITWAYATRRSESLAAAEKILREAEQHHPTEATIQFNLGCYACQRGDLVGARGHVDRAIELDDKFAELAATDPDLAALRDADCQPQA
jgi:predicted Zn-dependent protease